MLGGTNAWRMAKAPYGVTGNRAERKPETLAVGVLKVLKVLKVLMGW